MHCRTMTVSNLNFGLFLAWGRVREVKRVFLNTMIVGKGWSADEKRNNYEITHKPLDLN